MQVTAAESFFVELWKEYRPLAKLLIGTILEILAILLTLRGEQWFVGELGILSNQPASCTMANWFDCLHSLMVDFAVITLLGSFIVVSVVFIYRRSVHQIRAITLEQVKQYSEGLMSALTSLEASATDQDRIRAIDMLLQLRQANPTERRINLLLGRLYKARKDYDGAIEAVSWVLDNKRKANQAADKDYADLLYNRACYLALKASVVRDQLLSGQLKERAYQDLEASIALSPENALDARDDPDFATLRGEERFQKLMG